MCEISTRESRLPAIRIGYCAMLTIELRTEFLGRIPTCPRNQVKSAFIRQSPLWEREKGTRVSAVSEKELPL